jgi:hypothetical protein
VIARLTIGLAALAVLATPAPALAAVDSYRGKTSQGKRASARVVDGRVKLVKLAWSVPCRNDKNLRIFGTTKWTDTAEGPIEQAGDGTFTDSGRTKSSIGGGERADAKMTLAGQFDARHMTGKSTISAKIYNSAGKQVDTCKGTIRFDIPKV